MILRGKTDNQVSGIVWRIKEKRGTKVMCQKAGQEDAYFKQPKNVLFKKLYSSFCSERLAAREDHEYFLLYYVLKAASFC